MSLQSVAALFKRAAEPRKECSGARGVGAAVTACLLRSHCPVAGGGRDSGGVWPDETQMGCASIWPLALVSKEILCSPCDAEQEDLFWEQEEDGGRGANW